MSSKYVPTILIVDDNPKNIQIALQILNKKGYSLYYAFTGYDALEIIKNNKIDLVLLDIMMPNMDGYEVCKIIKNRYSNESIEIIFITAKVSSEDILKGLEYGAVDYIVKPFNHLELEMRVDNHLELISARKYYEEVSKKDGLTELYNHRYMIDSLEELFAKKDNQFSFIMFDLDLFKKINDIYGHKNGDIVLQTISNIISINIPNSAIPCRYGGEEFSVILPDIKIQFAYNIANKIKQKISNQKWVFGDLRVTISGGVVEFNNDKNITDFIKRADNLLYEAKHHGRDLILSDFH